MKCENLIEISANAAHKHIDRQPIFIMCLFCVFRLNAMHIHFENLSLCADARFLMFIHFDGLCLPFFILPSSLSFSLYGSGYFKCLRAWNGPVRFCFKTNTKRGKKHAQEITLSKMLMHMLSEWEGEMCLSLCMYQSITNITAHNNPSIDTFYIRTCLLAVSAQHRNSCVHVVGCGILSKTRIAKPCEICRCHIYIR